MSHTPGPWKPSHNIKFNTGAPNCYGIVGRQNGKPVTIATNMTKADAELGASALRLHAINAELLAALEAIAEMKIHKNTDHPQLSALCIAIARAAIAKAKDGKG